MDNVWREICDEMQRRIELVERTLKEMQIFETQKWEQISIDCDTGNIQQSGRASALGCEFGLEFERERMECNGRLEHED